jgi:hypothetical protein
MRKIIVLLWIFLLFPSIIWAQEKVDAPVWNVGDRWVFTQGNIEVVSSDQNSYTLKFSKDTCVIENKRSQTIILDKSTLNRIYIVMGDKRENYLVDLRRILNFPLNLGKEWNDSHLGHALKGQNDFTETFKIIGWENVKVQAGDFKSFKLEYTYEIRSGANLGLSGKAIYWYAPEVKYFVKCQYDKSFWRGVDDWELVSFKLKE